jgi:hypothetical protein
VVVCPATGGSSKNTTVCSLPVGQLRVTVLEYSVPSTRKCAPLGGFVEIVIVLEVCACKHSPPKVSSKSRDNRFINDTVYYIGHSTKRL